jgi:hypothetical protein
MGGAYLSMSCWAPRLESVVRTNLSMFYFDQTFLQTTVRIPVGGHHRGDFVVTMVTEIA